MPRVSTLIVAVGWVTIREPGMLASVMVDSIDATLSKAATPGSPVRDALAMIIAGIVTAKPALQHLRRLEAN